MNLLANKSNKGTITAFYISYNSGSLDNKSRHSVIKVSLCKAKLTAMKSGQL